MDIHAKYGRPSRSKEDFDTKNDDALHVQYLALVLSRDGRSPVTPVPLVTFTCICTIQECPALSRELEADYHSSPHVHSGGRPRTS
jgi:hypothetical protein